VELAKELEADDDAMDKLHRRLFRVLLSHDWSHGMEAAIDITLIGRYYERYADHAVRVARDVVYLVTGHRTPTDVPVCGPAAWGRVTCPGSPPPGSRPRPPPGRGTHRRA